MFSIGGESCRCDARLSCSPNGDAADDAFGNPTGDEGADGVVGPVGEAGQRARRAQKVPQVLSRR